MVLGVWPKEVRGEDWNLNNRLDPNENDGDASFPDDNADGVLDYGIAGMFTARTRPFPRTLGGEDRLSGLAGGDTLRITHWPVDDGIAFRVENQEGVVVLDDGRLGGAA